MSQHEISHHMTLFRNLRGKMRKHTAGAPQTHTHSDIDTQSCSTLLARLFHMDTVFLFSASVTTSEGGSQAPLFWLCELHVAESDVMFHLEAWHDSFKTVMQVFILLVTAQRLNKELFILMKINAQDNRQTLFCVIYHHQICAHLE